MGLAALRALVLEVNVAAHGMPVTVTLPGATATVETSGIWLTPDAIETPESGSEFRRVEGQWVLVLRKVDVPSVPVKTVIVGTPPGGTSSRWVVAGTAKVEKDRTYSILKPADS